MLENDRNLFDEMISNNNNEASININNNNINTGSYNISHMGTTSNPKPQNNISLRALPSLFWSDENIHEAAAKRFREDGNNEGDQCLANKAVDQNNSSSIATLLSSLNQLPQNQVLHQQTMMGSLSDGVFRSWYS